MYDVLQKYFLTSKATKKGFQQTESKSGYVNRGKGGEGVGVSAKFISQLT